MIVILRGVERERDEIIMCLCVEMDDEWNEEIE